jgi:soluble lytic murein transglycosylase-like protein
VRIHRLHIVSILFGCTCAVAFAQVDRRAEAEYYAAVYARHFDVPLFFVRALIAEESGWRRCPISTKGAGGIMQLMPRTARMLGVRDPCDLDQNISGGVRYLAHLMTICHGDLRLVAAAYLAGETRIQRRALSYQNPDVIAYVGRIQRATESPPRRGR